MPEISRLYEDWVKTWTTEHQHCPVLVPPQKMFLGLDIPKLLTIFTVVNSLVDLYLDQFSFSKLVRISSTIFAVIPVLPIRTLGWNSLSIACFLILLGISEIAIPPLVFWAASHSSYFPTTQTSSNPLTSPDSNS